jgi:glutamine synthetase
MLAKEQTQITENLYKLKAMENLFSQIGLSLVLGCELEFYTNQPLENLREELTKIDSLAELEKERGLNQHEIKFAVISKPIELVNKIAKVKNFFDLNEINYKSLPYPDQPGSSIHFHINFLKENGDNLFEDEQQLEFAVGGALKYLSESMIFFVSNEESFQRYKIHSMETPKNVSWGPNNRTTSIRIPTALKDKRRLEHRVTCSDADEAGALLHILAAIYLGLTKQIKPSAKIFGIAYDKIYNLEPLIDNLAKAEELYVGSEISQFVRSIRIDL